MRYCVIQVPLEVLESLSSNSRLYNVILENYPSLLLCRSLSDKKLDESNGDVGNKSGVTMSMRLHDWSAICILHDFYCLAFIHSTLFYKCCEIFIHICFKNF